MKKFKNIKIFDGKHECQFKLTLAEYGLSSMEIWTRYSEQKPKKILRMTSSSSSSNAMFWKTMQNIRKHRDIKPVTTDRRRNQLLSGPNYQTTKWFSSEVASNRNEQKRSKKEQASVFRSVNFRHAKDNYVWVFVWLHKTKVWRQDKTMLCIHEWRHIQSKIRNHLCRSCRRC